MKRRMGWLTSLLAMSMITGCASSPAVHQATFLRHEPTRVRSLLIVVDDTLFVEASREGDGARFARTLGSTLKNAAGSIPVTLLLIDSESDAKALPCDPNHGDQSHPYNHILSRCRQGSLAIDHFGCQCNAVARCDASFKTWHAYRHAGILSG